MVISESAGANSAMKTGTSQAMSSGDGADFVSPSQARLLLKNEEEHDKKFIGVSAGESSIRRDEDEGEFISPDAFSEFENKKSGSFPDTGPDISLSKAPTSKPAETGTALSGVQSDLLTRIAGELRTIKSELSNLKDHYDTTIAEREIKANGGAEDTRHRLDDEHYDDIKRLLSYLDKLLESLPEDRIDEFARSEYFELYRKVFEYFELT